MKGFGAEPGQVQQDLRSFNSRKPSWGVSSLASHASERFVKIKRCGCWGYHRSLFFEPLIPSRKAKPAKPISVMIRSCKASARRKFLPPGVVARVLLVEELCLSAAVDVGDGGSCTDHVASGYVNSLRHRKWPSRNSEFSHSMVIFHGYVNVYQRVANTSIYKTLVRISSAKIWISPEFTHTVGVKAGYTCHHAWSSSP